MGSIRRRMSERPIHVYVRAASVLVLLVGLVASAALDFGGAPLGALLVVVFLGYTAADVLAGERRRGAGMAVVTVGYAAFAIGDVVGVPALSWAGIAVGLLAGAYVLLLGLGVDVVERARRV